MGFRASIIVFEISAMADGGLVGAWLVGQRGIEISYCNMSLKLQFLGNICST